MSLGHAEILSKCTIVIPTHNRADYLRKCVRWFSEFGCPIVIADSSAIANGEMQSNKVRYIHYPGDFSIYRRKLQMAMAKVQTPFVAMCADDDFIGRDGLAASVSFLAAHPDYSFSQGYSYLYQAFGSNLVVWPMVYPFHNNESEDWLTRIENAKSTVYYGVNRTEVVRDAIDFIANQDFSDFDNGSAGFIDTSLTLHVARAGKFKRCDVPFAFREYSPVVHSVGARFGSIVSRQVADFYANLSRALLCGESRSDADARLSRLFAENYSGQLSYDLAVQASRRTRFRGWPSWSVGSAEYLFRLYNAAKMYTSSDYREFMRVFATADYRQFKNFVVGSASVSSQVHDVS